MKFVVLLVTALSAALAADHDDEICPKLESCEDARIKEILKDTAGSIAHNYKAEDKSNGGAPLFQLDAKKSTVDQNVDLCRDTYKVTLELVSRNKLTNITRFFIQGCNDNGHFIEETTEWKPVKCEHSQDSVLSDILKIPRTVVTIPFIAPCNNRIVFRYVVQDATNHLHGPYTMKHRLPAKKNVITHSKLKMTSNVQHAHERVRRATTGHLVLGNRLYIHQLSLDGSRVQTIASGLTFASTVDFHFEQGQLFWADRTDRKIMRSNLDGTMKTVVLDQGIGLPEGLAIDWINDKLYWADFSNKKIGVLDLSTSMHKSLISTGSSSNPRGIAVDPIRRIIFWTDWYSSSPKIERASMDGTNRTILINSGVTLPFAITLDYSLEMVYWADQSLDRIETADYNGSNRRVVVSSGLQRVFDITLFEDTLYWSDWSLGISSTNKNGGQSVATIYDTTQFCTNIFPFGIQVIAESRQLQVSNPCGSNNGGCSHFCLLSFSQSSNYTCGCPDDMMLQTDMRTCTFVSMGTTTSSPTVMQGSCAAAGYLNSCCQVSNTTSCAGSPATCYCDAQCIMFGDCCSDVPQECSTLQAVGPYIVFSNKRYIHTLSMDGTRTRTIRSGLNNSIGIDYHYSMGYMFWTDIDTDQIWRSRLDGSNARLLLANNLRTPEDVAVDWISNKLYWTDNAYDSISVMDIETGLYTTLINTGANTIPRSIVVDPINRFMYWTDRSSAPRIEGASMDGTSRAIIHSTNLNQPDGLTLDLSTRRLYWIDFQRRIVESSLVDGTDRRTVVSQNIFQPFGLSMLGDILYYSDWLVGISSADISDGMVSIFFDNLCESAFGVEVVSEERQPTGPNPCATSNGGCDQLCLLSATNSSGYSCLCVSGFTLGTDQRNCSSDTPVMTPTTPPEPSCTANYSTWCTTGLCQGYPPEPSCFCNIQCCTFGDCCSDFLPMCPGPQNPTMMPPLNISISSNISLILPTQITPQFNCTVTGGTDPTFQWQFTSDRTQIQQSLTDVSGATLDAKYIIGQQPHSSSLTINGAMFTDTGVYKCIANGATFTLESSARLTVLVPPTMLQVTVDRSVIQESEVLLFVCMLRAYPFPTITWAKSSDTESTAILNGTRTSITVEHLTMNNYPITVSRLSIAGARVMDSGNYVCEAFNGIQGYSAVSGSRNVTVIGINECLNQPCLNGGTCEDYPNGYSCVCTDGFFGDNCSQIDNQGNEQQSAPVINNPPDNTNVSLTTAINLTCMAEGHPAPRYEWYKDGVILPGETRSYLHIPEALPEDRGNYTCKAINNEGEIESDPARLAIQGVYQYVANVELSRSMTSSGEAFEEILSIVGLMNNDSTFYSIEVLNTMESENATILITVLSNTSTPSAVRTLIYNQLEGSGTVSSVISLIRHDGCNAEFDTTTNYEWPEASIGETVYGPCPCDDLIPEGLMQSSMAIRFCDGSNSGSGMWRDGDYSQCAAVINELSQGLCNDLMNVNTSPVNASESIVRRTSQPENLTSDDVITVTEAVVRLTEEAIVNPEVRDNYLGIIDNIQMADPETVLESQSSSRLLESLGQFLDRLEIPANTTGNQTVLTYQTYAIQVQDIDPERFSGQTLNIDLGSAEEAMNMGRDIDDDALITSEMAMNVLANATGTIQTSEPVLEFCSQRAMEYGDTTLNTTLKIGSLILATRLSCGPNATLNTPLRVTLRTNAEIEMNATNSSCATWDANRFGAWSSDGCREVTRGDNKRVCECTQLAHFGILFDLNPRPISGDVALGLAVITYIGVVLSLLCLIIFIVTYLAVKKLRSNVHGKILVNMSVALIGLYVSFLISGRVTPYRVVCGFSAAFLHYFMVVFFAWTLVEVLWLYLKLVKIFGVKQYEAKFIPVSMLVVWLVPLPIVAISAGAGHEYYTRPFYCRATEWPFYFAVILPFLLMYIFDWIMFFVIMGSICKNRKSINSQVAAAGKSSDTSKIWKQNFVIAVGLSTTFGLGWGFGLLATSHDIEELSTAFQYLFSIFVGFQGILLFLFHGVRNTDAQNAWKKLLVIISKPPRKVYNIAHSISQEKNLTASPSTDSYGFSTTRQTETDTAATREYETIDSAAAAETFINTKANEAYGKFNKKPGRYENISLTNDDGMMTNDAYTSVAPQESDGNYDTPGTVMSTNQAYGRVTGSSDVAYQNPENIYDEI